MPICTLHHAYNGGYVVIRDAFVKQIAHRIHKDHLWRCPTKRVSEFYRHNSQIKTLLVRMAGYAPKSFSKYFSITMFATRANLGAPAHWIPRSVGPFDF